MLQSIASPLAKGHILDLLIEFILKLNFSPTRLLLLNLNRIHPQLPIHHLPQLADLIFQLLPPLLSSLAPSAFSLLLCPTLVPFSFSLFLSSVFPSVRHARICKGTAAN